MVIDLHTELAPTACKNFLKRVGRANASFVRSHRRRITYSNNNVQKDFVVQAGDEMGNRASSSACAGSQLRRH